MCGEEKKKNQNNFRTVFRYAGLYLCSFYLTANLKAKRKKMFPGAKLKKMKVALIMIQLQMIEIVVSEKC